MSITLEEVIETLDKIVEEFGEDYVYPDWQGGCSYSTPTGEPSCLVGQVAFRLQPSAFDVFRYYESSPGMRGSSFNISGSYYPATEFDLADNARRFLADVQIYQDGGETWANSVKLAKENLEKA